MKYIYFVQRTKVRAKSNPPRLERLLFHFSPVLQESMTYAKHASNRYKRSYSVLRNEYNSFGELIATRAIAVYTKGIRVFEDKKSHLAEPDPDPVASTPHPLASEESMLRS